MPKKIIPYMSYQNAQAAVDFLKTAFGFEEVSLHRNEDGSIMHAELKIGNEYIMLGSVRESKLNLQPPKSQDSPVNMGIYLFTDNVEKLYEQSRAAGAAVVYELEEKDYGSTEFTVKDTEGNLWSFGTYMPEADNE